MDSNTFFGVDVSTPGFNPAIGTRDFTPVPGDVVTFPEVAVTGHRGGSALLWIGLGIIVTLAMSRRR